MPEAPEPSEAAEPAEGTGLPPEVDTSRPQAARMYDYFIGGKNHFASDQETADKVIAVYADNDPLVLVHARALLTSSPAGKTAYIQADPRDPAAILSSPVEYLPVESASAQRAYKGGGVPMRLRDGREFAEIAFAGLDLVPPGVVLVSDWRPDSGPHPLAHEVNCHGGVARKP